VLAGSFAGLETASTLTARLRWLGQLGRFRSLTVPLSLGSPAPFPCKTLLLVMGVVGLTATRAKIEEGLIANSVKKL
jgi:hypothetical protein